MDYALGCEKGEFNNLEDSACPSETRLVKESLNLPVIAVIYEVKDKQSHRKKMMEMITINTSIRRNNV